MITQVKDLVPLNAKERVEALLEIAEDVWDDRPFMAKVAVSQAILESGITGKISGLALQNNLFGIKGEGNAGTSRMGTTEFINGREITVRAGFAVNTDIFAAFNQHRQLLIKYRYRDVLDSRTANEAFEELQEAGYATDPDYADKLKRVYNSYFK